MPSPTRLTQARQYHILGVILLSAGLILAIELVSGGANARFLRLLVGWGALPLALLLAAAGLYLLLRQRLAPQLAKNWYIEFVLGVQALFVAALAATHLSLGADSYLDAQAGRGGGMVGWALSDLLREGMGAAGAWFVVIALTAVGLFLIFNYSPLRALPLPAWLIPAPRPARRPEGGGRKAEGGGRRAEGGETGKSGKGADAPAAKPAPPPAAARAPAIATQPPATQPAAARPVEPAAKPIVAPTTATVARGLAPPPTPRRGKKLPPLDLLQGEDKGGSSNQQAAIQAAIIEDTLASFGIPAKVVETNIGPTVTQFGVAPGNIQKNDRILRVRVNQIVSLSDDLALALAASPVRIEAPVPGRPYVGIEVPNPDSTLVSLRRLLQDRAFKKIGAPLAVPFGRDVSGAIVAADLHKLPHLLIAGATGSGKSVALNAIICSLLFNNTPDALRLILVDPKRVEFPGYNGIPHLVAPVVTEIDHAGGALSWLLIEMDERYRRFAARNVRNITAFNESAPASERLPYLVLVIDELADMMMTAPEVIEAKLVRLAQMARATGIHLVVATQRPSVDVVTGLIKANFPARLAFAVTSQIDSRVILDTPGAEKLLGRGDGLLMTADSAKLRRIQGCFVSDNEIGDLVRWWQTNYPAPPPDPTRPRYPWSQLMADEATADDLMQQAIEKLRSRQTISVSGLQRLLGVGYPRAARLMEELETEGIVGPEGDRRTGRPVLIEDEDLLG
ncbi:MAG: DNA translocase FtsK 4TM domain-containing protein [Caldilineales bacterium]|nr:DNA translocase FtsK 4TM domain-containing protein [Caldilineales bacterium]